MDLARSIQEVTDEVVLRLVRTMHRETGAENLCLAGGVALNCVANGRILREGPFKGMWIQPSAGDAGGAVGAALNVWHQLEDKPRSPDRSKDNMQGSFLGPAYSNDEIERLAELIKAISARGTGVLLVEHHADLIFDICHYVTVLNLGRTLAAGTPAEIRVHKEVVSAYLGG